MKAPSSQPIFHQQLQPLFPMIATPWTPQQQQTSGRCVIKAGDRITEDTGAIVLEAMKQEMTLLPDNSGTVVEILCEPGQLLTAGQIYCVNTAIAGLLTSGD